MILNLCMVTGCCYSSFFFANHKFCRGLGALSCLFVRHLASVCMLVLFLYLLAYVFVVCVCVLLSVCSCSCSYLFCLFMLSLFC